MSVLDLPPRLVCDHIHSLVSKHINEYAGDKAHPVVFRVTFSLADAIIFLLVCKDPLTGNTNPKEIQDRKFPILSPDGLEGIRSEVRDAKRKEKASNDIRKFVIIDSLCLLSRRS